jgi:hypothetical protein
MGEIYATLTCECGKEHLAKAADAGTLISCACGRSITVPTLSKLRLLAGKDAYVTNPAEAIRKMQYDGVSPAGDRCITCGAGTPVEYTCHAMCESPRLKHAPVGEPHSLVPPFLRIAGIILFGWAIVLFGHLLLSRRKRPTENETIGHEVYVTFPLPVCDACAAANGGVTRPAVARKLMVLVPVYKELLDYYPQSVLSVTKPMS